MSTFRTPKVLSLFDGPARRGRAGIAALLMAVLLAGGCHDQLESAGPQVGLSSNSATYGTQLLGFSIDGAVESGSGGRLGGAEQQPAAVERKLVQNGELQIKVEDCEAARRAVEAELKRVGGYLANVEVTHREGRASRMELLLRLPAEAFGSGMDAFAALGTVLHEKLSTEDITERFFDTEARLANQRKLEARLQELLAKQTGGVKDLLEVERELARVRETIERHEGKLRLWSNQVAFSTLKLTLSTVDVRPIAESRSLGEKITTTLSDSWDALLRAGSALVLFVVALLPWLLPMLGGCWSVLWLGRRVFGRRAPQPD